MEETINIKASYLKSIIDERNILIAENKKLKEDIKRIQGCLKVEMTYANKLKAKLESKTI